jgi:hypothetical protein
MIHQGKGATLCTVLCYSLGACQDSSGPRPFTPTLDIAVCQPSAGPFSSSITNPYFPAAVGNQWVLEGTEQGKAVVLQITALNSTEVVAGVTTRVVEERETQDGALVEVSRNFFAQAPDGTVCYYGEDVDIYEGGVVTSHEGQWRAGVAGALSGIFMPASPAKGQAFEQEVAAGVARDRVEIVAAGETTAVPFGTFSNTIRFRETTPLEPGVESTKVYVNTLGPIVDDVVRLTGMTP